MDLAYDPINQDAFDKKDGGKKGEGSNGGGKEEPEQSLNEEFQEAYKAISNSPWGMRIGGFLGNAVKQGQTVYQEATKEVAELGQDAAKGLNTLQKQIVSHTRSLSINTTQQQGGSSRDVSKEGEDKGDATPTGTSDEAATGDSAGYLERLRTEAAKRLKDLQKAEDAADEALLKFGSNIRDFLREAVSIAPPSDANNQGSTVLFESKDASGKRVIHTSRQEAQLHVIHTSTESYAKDPATDDFTEWTKSFDVEKKTADISDDLAKYPELRTTMEKLVPDQVPYADFWQRYYFLRHGLDAAEARRRDLLKAAEADDEVGWGDDSDDESPQTKAQPQSPKELAKKDEGPARPASAESSTTLAPRTATTLKPAESRKSNDEKSQADSEASYDVVGERSGVPSQAPSSPKESRKGDDSDEEDWE